VSPDVKPRGTEQARTRLARAAVVDAARTLFVRHGYAATTLESISAEAGVPQATLYRLFASKIGVLKAVLDVAAGGDDQPIAFGDRPDVQRRLRSADPHDQLDSFAELTAAVMSRVSPIQYMLIGAAATDSEAAELLTDFARQRQVGQARIAAALARRRALREGVTERLAADTLYALMSPEVYRMMTVDRGWSASRYQRWLSATLRRQLLDEP
jgi:AcrR family transcriptional regulator